MYNHVRVWYNKTMEILQFRRTPDEVSEIERLLKIASRRQLTVGETNELDQLLCGGLPSDDEFQSAFMKEEGPGINPRSVESEEVSSCCECNENGQVQKLKNEKATGCAHNQLSRITAAEASRLRELLRSV